MRYNENKRAIKQLYTKVEIWSPELVSKLGTIYEVVRVLRAFATVRNSKCYENEWSVERISEHVHLLLKLLFILLDLFRFLYFI